MSSGFDPVIGALNSVMNLRQMNQNVIAGNIANADTPGFKAQRLDFEASLRDALHVGDGSEPAVTRPGHRSRATTDAVNPEVYDDPNGVESLDGNTVNRAEEMTAMAENQLVYDAAAELVKRKLGMLKYSINEGGGGAR